jgi:cobalt/nickel transport system permease protein
MIPIHLAIGVVEGLATAAVVAFVAQARPEALPVVGKRPVWVALAVGAALLGGIVSWFASSHPDGLEWSIARVVGSGEMTASEAGVHKQLGAWQEKTAFLPDYGFKADAAEEASAERAVSEPEAWPAVRVGTSTAGIVGGALTLALALLIGVAVKWRPSPAAAGNG